jgi:hypothetical protein
MTKEQGPSGLTTVLQHRVNKSDVVSRLQREQAGQAGKESRRTGDDKGAREIRIVKVEIASFHPINFLRDTESWRSS